MGKSGSKYEVYEDIDEEMEKVKRLIEKQGVVCAQDEMRKKLIRENWREVEVKIGVTGVSNVGKSSFINSFRGIDDGDEQAAKTGLSETTSEPAPYPYPGNPKIILMDLPAIGTPTCPDIETYCNQFGFETYDTFFILTETRFTLFELELAQKIESMGKSFFIIRTKMDLAESNEKRQKNPNIEEMAKKIRAYCHDCVKNHGIREDEVFLVSNNERDKWEIDRLAEATIAKLPIHQKEALTLSLKVLSKDVVRRKVAVLESRIWMVRLLFFFAFPFDIITLGLPSHCIERSQIKRNRKVYRSQLGLPEEDSDEFSKLKPEFQYRLRELFPKEDTAFCARYCERILHPTEIVFASCTTSDALCKLLTEMENLALELLEEAATKTEGDME